MPVSLNEPDDLTLINLERVAVKGEKIRFGETAIRTISASNKAFLEYVSARPTNLFMALPLITVRMLKTGSTTKNDSGSKR